MNSPGQTTKQKLLEKILVVDDNEVICSQIKWGLAGMALV